MSAPILSLPVDVVRLIPTSYRMWQCIRLTCTTLNAHLGDYHEARDLMMCCDFDERRTLTYREFVTGLIDNMSRALKGKRYVMYKLSYQSINVGDDSNTIADRRLAVE